LGQSQTKLSLKAVSYLGLSADYLLESPASEIKLVMKS